MRHWITIIGFLLAGSLHGQTNNIYATSGVAYTNGAPTFIPGSRGSLVAIDTVTGYWWVNPSRTAASWVRLGDRVQPISGCSAPSGAPSKYNSLFVINACAAPELYYWNGSSWKLLNGGGGGGGSVNTDATLDGDGSGGDPLKIAAQSASENQILRYTGTTWLPSWGNPHTFVTSGATITSAINELLIGTASADITIGLPTCNAALDSKRFKIIKNGTDAFFVKIDPSGSETFYDGTSQKIQYGKVAIDCTCRFSAGVGVWFFDNF